MKKNWLKKVSAALFAATLFASGFAINANAQDIKGKVDGNGIATFELSDYKDLMDKDVDNGSITVTKNIATYNSNGSVINENTPVGGVTISVTKIGDYATYVDGNGTASVLMGIKTDILTAANNVIENVADRITGIESGDYTYLTSAQFDKVNEALMKVQAEVLNSYAGKPGTVTDANGTARFTGLVFGIYLVREDSVTGAYIDAKGADGSAPNGQFDQSEAVAFKKKQAPYIVSIPDYNEASTEDNKWDTAIETFAKNDDVTTDITKEIIRNSNALTTGNTIVTENLRDTDVTHISDTVEFALTTTVPMVDPAQSNDKIDSFEINDRISAGLTLPTNWTDKITIVDGKGHVYKRGDDASSANAEYYITKDNVDADATEGTPSAYHGGDAFKIVFTQIGLDELTTLAKNETEAERALQVRYTVTVDTDAVVDAAGNPNKVQLQFKAAGSSEISTSWHEVTEFIFTMTGNKQFDGQRDDTKAESVKFKLYQDDKLTQGVKLINNNNGTYTYQGTVDTSTGTDATEISLTDSSFEVIGVPTTNETANNPVTLYLVETETYAGYNKLTQPVKIVLTADTDDNTDKYNGYLESTKTTVNDKTVITGETTDVSFSVNNTKGFQLPSTGGMGIWMFVIGGMAVIGCGLLYYRKNAKSAK